MYKITLKARGQQFEYSCPVQCYTVKSSAKPVYPDSDRLPAGRMWNV